MSSFLRQTAPAEKVHPGNDLLQIWTDILGCKISKQGDDSREWYLENNRKWLDGTTMLYNRACYEEILLAIETEHPPTMLIRGTPGIGKTTFFFRLLVWIVETAHVNQSIVPTIVIHFPYNDHGFWLCSDGSIEIFNALIHGRPDYYLSDAVDFGHKMGSVLHIEVASSKRINFNKFKR